MYKERIDDELIILRRIELKESEKEEDLDCLEKINTEMTNFVVRQSGGDGWLKLWEASKLRRRQKEGKHSFDPTPEETANILERPTLAGEVVIEESPNIVSAKEELVGSRWLAAIQRERFDQN